MVPATVVTCDMAAVESKVTLVPGGRVKVPEPVNAVETPLVVTVPLKDTFVLEAVVYHITPCGPQIEVVTARVIRLC